MIKSLDIVNFQSHLETHIDFADGVNLIVGKSDCGKSAILRALNWVVSNRPLGDGFLRDDATDSTLVHLATDSGFVERCKGDKENFYSLNGNIFEAFGTSVPAEITDFLNFSDVNIQGQLSPYFLILDSSGQIALYLREVCKLDKLDSLYSDLTSKLNKCTEDEKRYDEEYDSITSNPIMSIEVGEMLDVLEFSISEYEEKDKQSKELLNSINTLKALISSISSTIEAIKPIPDGLEDGLQLFSLLQDSVGSIYTQKNKLSDTILGFESLSFVTLPDELFVYFEKLDSLLVKGNELDDGSLRIIDLIKDMVRIETSYDSNLSKLEELESLQLYSYSTLKICPICEQSIDEKRIDIVMDNLKG